MFFKRKKQDDLYQQLESQLLALSQEVAASNEALEGLSQKANGLDGLGQGISSLEQKISQLHSDVHKHDMAIEDLLDEWEEKKSDEESVNACLQEAERTESLLLGLFEAYQEQFWNLKHFALTKEEGTWAAQIALMEKNLELYRRSCAITVIQECGVDVDYGLHDIIEAIDTTNPAKDKTIAEIYRSGYLYKGKVKKKAQAAAYRFSNTEAANK